ncbi:hypothetical protein ES708_25177 [subsurface metagenome]
MEKVIFRPRVCPASVIHRRGSGTAVIARTEFAVFEQVHVQTVSFGEKRLCADIISSGFVRCKTGVPEKRAVPVKSGRSARPVFLGLKIMPCVCRLHLFDRIEYGNRHPFSIRIGQAVVNPIVSGECVLPCPGEPVDRFLLGISLMIVIQTYIEQRFRQPHVGVVFGNEKNKRRFSRRDTVIP